MNYTKHFSKKQTSQTEKIPGSNQVRNSAGGYSFKANDFSRLDRFLILGSEGGTYYISEKKLTIENATCVQKCLDKDYKKTIDRIVEISVNGRAPKNDPALFALAIASGDERLEVRKYALEQLNKVARIGTHLFTFVNNVQHFRKWGRQLRTSISNWYIKMPIEKLSYQVVKYQQRNG